MTYAINNFMHFRVLKDVQCLWTPIMQYSDRGNSSESFVRVLLNDCTVSEMSALAFDHLLQLSFNFHTHRNTGALLRVLDRGAAINHTLEVRILWSTGPAEIDLPKALAVHHRSYLHRYCSCPGGLLLQIRMDPGIGCLHCHVCIRSAALFLCSTSSDTVLVAASIIITRWRTKIRRQMNERDVVSTPSVSTGLY